MKVTKFEASSGISWQDKNDNWFKVGCTIGIEIEDGDDVAEVKRKAWNTVHAECEKQIKEVMQG